MRNTTTVKRDRVIFLDNVRTWVVMIMVIFHVAFA